jgi:hypothetical protein
MQMPTAWLSLFDQVFILALIPLMNGVVYPTLDKFGVSVSLLTRIGKSCYLSLKWKEAGALAARCKVVPLHHCGILT